MNILKTRAAALLSVKSIVTICTTVVFCYQAVTGGISQDFMTVYTVIIAFYFGTQAIKNSSASEVSRDEDKS